MDRELWVLSSKHNLYAWNMRAVMSPYSSRLALPADAGTIAHHRAMMFRDMHAVDQAEGDRLFAASLPWMERLLGAGEYIGWLVLFEDEVVAGGGIHVRDTSPVPGCCREGRGGHIMNVYTVEAHRRRGLARFLLQTILEWGARNRLDPITLTASDAGRPLYESLGFIPTHDMRWIATKFAP
jgi:GNAT superfamily N-acetyltransferase